MCLQRTALLFLLGLLLFPINVLSADDEEEEDNPGLRSPTVNVIIINGGAINPTCDVNPVTDTCDSDDVTVQWFSTVSGTCLYGYSSTSSNPIKLSCTTDAKLQVSWVVAGINTFRIHASQSHTSFVYTSATITGIAPTPPPVPGAIKGPASTTGDYTLNWGSSTGATSYILVEQIGDNTDTTEYVVTGTSKSFTGKSNGNYSYQVKACVGSKYCSDLTATKTVTVTPTAEITINGVSAATCVIPAGATLCNTADVTVSWTSNVPGACVYVSDTNLFACSQGSFQVRWIGARTYTFKVHQSRSSDASVLASATILPTPRVPSAIIGSTNSKDGSYTLNWGSSRGTTMYTLQAMIGAGDWTTVQNTTTRSKSFSGKTNGTYKYRVKACSSSSFCSDWTATHTVTVKLNTTPVVAAIANQRVLVNGTQRVTVTITDSDAGDTHTVTATASNTSTATVSVSGKTLTITGKAVGSSTIKVTATDNSGATNATSAEVSFTVYVPPPVPGSITGPGDSTTGSYTLNWGSSTGATSYKLEEQIPGAATPTVHVVTGAAKSFTGKSNGDYSYQVKACVGSNCSGLTTTHTVTVKLNTAPVVTAIATQRAPLSGTQSVTVTITDSDAGDTHTVTAISSNTSAATVSVSGKTLTITGKAVGSSTIKVTATDNSGATNATSAEVSFTVYVPPPVPGSITGPGDSTTGSYTLNWGSSTGATSYKLEEQIPGAATPTVHVTTGATKSFTGKSNGDYSYQVKACVGSNCSGLTTTHTVTVKLNTAPVVTAIATQRVLVNGTQSVTVTITDSDAGDTHTVSATASNTSAATVSVSGKTLTITGKAVGSSTIRVTAKDNSGASNATSAEVSFTVYVPPPVPGPITGPGDSTTGSYTLNWGSATGATSYKLEEQIPGAATPTVHVITGATKSFTGKSNGDYSYQVKACVGSNCSGLTTTHTVTVKLNTAPVVTAIATQRVSVDDKQSVTVTITDSDAGDTHTVTATASNTSAATVSVSSKTLTITGKAVGSSTIKVTATDNSGATNAISAEVSFTVYVPPPVPGSITGPGDSTTGSYTLNWGSSTGATSYTLQERLNSGNWSTVQRQNSATTTESFSGKSDGTYGYQVKACAGSTNCSGWTTTYTVTVTLNSAPVIVGLPERLTVPVGTTKKVIVQVNDADTGDSHSISARSHITDTATVTVNGNTLSITGKASGGSIIEVTATDDSGASNNTSPKAAFLVTVPSAPPPPTPPVPGSITGPGDSTTGNYTLNWGSSTGATSYTLEERLNSGSWTEVQDSTATTKTFSGKTNGTYDYQVKACAGSNNCSDWTSTFTVSVSETDTPVVVAITDQMVTIDSTVDVTVIVMDTRPNITSYSIAAVSSAPGVATVSVDEYTLTITGVAAGSSTISVTATDNNGVRGLPTTFDVVTATASNSTPIVNALATQMVSVNGMYCIAITVTDADALDAHIVTATSSDTSVATVSISDQLLDIKGLTVGSSTITVSATDNSEASNARSAEVTFTVYVFPLVPSPIIGPGTSTDGSYTLNWGNSTGATSYTLQEISSGGKWTTVQNTAATSKTFTGTRRKGLTNTASRPVLAALTAAAGRRRILLL